jgi:hypothetical protein
MYDILWTSDSQLGFINYHSTDMTMYVLYEFCFLSLSSTGIQKWLDIVAVCGYEYVCGIQTKLSNHTLKVWARYIEFINKDKMQMFGSYQILKYRGKLEKF